MWSSKNGTPYYVYYDLDSHGYRNCNYNLESEALIMSDFGNVMDIAMKDIL